jgi:hypothetical protein
MRIFQVPLMVTPGQDSDFHHRAFFRRLSGFVNLECLSLTKRYVPREHEEYLCLQLEKGLEQLSTLRKLRILDLPAYDPKMGSIDLEVYILLLLAPVVLMIMRRALARANMFFSTKIVDASKMEELEDGARLHESGQRHKQCTRRNPLAIRDRLQKVGCSKTLVRRVKLLVGLEGNAVVAVEH